MSSPPPAPRAATEFDPVYRHSRREALVILGIWLAALLWAVPYCYLNGYGEAVPPEALETVLGVPAWVFWGIAVPWLAADLATVWFCFAYMRDDDLGEAHEGADVAEELARERREDRA